jgi:hypothetical protein
MAEKVHTMKTKRGLRYYVVTKSGRYKFVKKPK